MIQLAVVTAYAPSPILLAVPVRARPPPLPRYKGHYHLVPQSHALHRPPLSLLAVHRHPAFHTVITSLILPTPPGLPLANQAMVQALNAHRNIPRPSNAISALSASLVHTISGLTCAPTRMSAPSCAACAAKRSRASTTVSDTKACTQERRSLFAGVS
jgi:hypothetical protein